MKLRGRLASDLVSIAASQAIAALGQLVGVRILTELLSPAVFGEVSLLLGVVTLATSALLNPTLQTLLRYYPVYAQSGDPSPVERVALRQIQRIFALVVPLSLPLGVLAVAAGWCSPVGVVLLLIMMAVDGLRMYRTTIMNASRQHTLYGAWLIGEAWGRPLLAFLATRWWGVHAETVLGAFILLSIILYVSMSRSFDAPTAAGSRADVDGDDLLRKFGAYSRPLIPIGFFGWISGMADRYMIGGLISAHDVGMYAAAYGLASRPLLMLSTVAETTIRPAYYAAIGRNDPAASRKYLVAWFVIVAAVGATACSLFALFHHQLARLLLGPEFRDASHLMPWIAAGYGVLGVYHISVRICLAHDATRAVTISEAAGAVFAIVIGFVFIKTHGLTGAAVAVPIYCSMQLATSTVFAVRSSRRGRS